MNLNVETVFWCLQWWDLKWQIKKFYYWGGIESAWSSNMSTTLFLMRPSSLALNGGGPTPAWQAGLCQRRNSGCGTGWLLAGAGFLPLWQSVSMVYVLLCWGVFPVPTLYSPRSIVSFFLFFFTFLMLCCIFSSPVYLLAFHYSLYPVWLCMWRIIKNQPWTLQKVLTIVITINYAKLQ